MMKMDCSLKMNCLLKSDCILLNFSVILRFLNPLCMFMIFLKTKANILIVNDKKQKFVTKLSTCFQKTNQTLLNLLENQYKYLE